MKDPPRWSTSSALPEQVSRALRAGREIGPPPEAHDRVLAGVLSAVATGVAGAAAAQSSVHAGKALGAGLSTGAKVGLGFVSGIALTLGVTTAIQLKDASEAARAHAPAASAQHTEHEPARLRTLAAPAPVAVEPIAASTPAASEPPEQAEPAGAPVALQPAQQRERAARATAVRAPTPAGVSETQMILEARAQLRRGEFAAALRSLDRATGVKDPVLRQERELLRIRVLRGLRHMPEARALAAAFLARNPESPYAAELQALASKP